MTFAPVVSPYQPINGLTGLGLNNGALYIGADGSDPQVVPQQCYWDAAGTIPAPQPIPITGGYPMYLGSPARLYTGSVYSIRVRDASGVQVFYEAHAVPGGTDAATALLAIGFFPSVAAARAATIPTPLRSLGITALGYYALGDGGGGAYIYAPSQAAGVGKFQSADGAWWQIVSAKKLNVRAFGALGDGTGLTAQSYFGGLSAAQAIYPFAVNANQTLDYLAAEAASLFAWAAGGGSVYWPNGHYVSSRSGDQHVLRPHVSYEGDGYGSWLDYFANCFISQGMDPPDMTLVAWKPLNNFTAGAQTVTTTSPADAANFLVNQLVYVTSVATDSAGTYSFMELVKVVGVNVGTGVITLEEPIEDAVTGAQIGISTFYGVNPLPEGCEVHHLRLTANAANGSQCFAINGAYKCFFHHCWTSGMRGLSHNGTTKCVFSDMVMVVMAYPDIYNYGLAVEAQQGCYNTSYKRLKVAIVNVDGSQVYNGSNLFALGQRARGVSVEDVEVLAPTINLQNVFTFSIGARNSARNIRVLCQNLDSGFNLAGQYQGAYFLPTLYRLRDITITVTGLWSRGGIFSDTDNANPRGDEVSNFTIVGAQGAVNGATPRSFLWIFASDCVVRDSSAAGPYGAISGPLRGYIYNSNTGGPLDATARGAIQEVSCQVTGPLAPPAPFAITNQNNINSTTPNNPLGSLTFPANFPWSVGDRIHFRIKGSFNGTANTKNVAIADNGAVLLTLTAIAADTTPFFIEGDIDVTLLSSTLGYRLSAMCIHNGTAQMFEFNSSAVVSGAISFTLQAWVANAADSAYIIKSDFQYARAESSLSGGATLASA